MNFKYFKEGLIKDDKELIDKFYDIKHIVKLIHNSDLYEELGIKEQKQLETNTINFIMNNWEEIYNGLHMTTNVMLLNIRDENNFKRYAAFLAENLKDIEKNNLLHSLYLAELNGLTIITPSDVFGIVHDNIIPNLKEDEENTELAIYFSILKKYLNSKDLDINAIAPFKERIEEIGIDNIVKKFEHLFVKININKEDKSTYSKFSSQVQLKINKYEYLNDIFDMSNINFGFYKDKTGGFLDWQTIFNNKEVYNLIMKDNVNIDKIDKDFLIHQYLTGREFDRKLKSTPQEILNLLEKIIDERQDIKISTDFIKIELLKNLNNTLPLNLEIDKKNMIENLDLMIAGSNLTDVVKALSNVKFDGIDECKKHLYTNYDDDLKALTTSIMSENKDFDNNKIYKEIIIPFMEYNDEYTKQNSRRNKPK